jgi:uncharacterized protein
MAAVVLTIVMVAYNNFATNWPAFNGAAYVPANALAGATLGALALGPLGLSPADLGITDLGVKSYLIGAGLGAVLALPMFVGLFFERTTRLLADGRVHGLAGGRLLYEVAVRVPIGTAAFEELAFRGVLFAEWRQVATVPVAAAVSSVAFGLWHVAPTLDLMHANRRHDQGSSEVIAVTAMVIALTIAGLGLAWVRVVSDGLATPWAVHATLNSLTIVAGVVAHRRRRG